MPLFRPTTQSTATPEEAIATVHHFLQKCLQWAEDKEIPETMEKLKQSPDKKLAARLHQWTIYREFTLHTLKELEDGTLDHWFQFDPKTDADGINGI